MPLAPDPLARYSPEQRALLTKLVEIQNQRAVPVAIVGMACRFPGGCNTPEEFWSMLAEGRDPIVEVPPARWNNDAVYSAPPTPPGRTNTRWGGFVDGHDQFDAGFFEISPTEATTVDPQHRLLLEVSYEALESSGLPYRGRRIGNFVGCASLDFFTLDSPAILANPYAATGVSGSVLSTRVSYTFDLRGPTMTIAAACTSSLVAIHLACESLAKNECDAALAAGVNMLLTPKYGIMMASTGAQSPTGRCRSYDAAADGFVRSEAIGVVVLKRLDRAIADGDEVLAVVRGTAVAHGGRGNGLTAPRGGAQEDVVRRAFDRAGLEPKDATLFEGMGSGSPLGDAIEVRAFSECLESEDDDDDSEVLLASVKSVIGHTEGAAGIAAVIKSVLSFRHEAVPRNLHFDAPNPIGELAGSRFRVPTKLEPWPEGREKVIGINTFAFDGNTAHLVLTGSPEDAEARFKGAETAPLNNLSWPFAVSAKTPSALRVRVLRTVELLRRGETSVYDAAFTSTVRRVPLKHRIAVVGASADDLADALERGIETPSTAGAAPKVVVLCAGAIDARGDTVAFLVRSGIEPRLVLGNDADRTDAIAASFARDDVAPVASTEVHAWLGRIFVDDTPVFVRLGQRSDLDDAVDQAAARNGVPAVVFPIEKAVPREELLRCLAGLFSRGVEIAWKPTFAAPGRAVELVPYPWERTRFWPDDAKAVEAGATNGEAALALPELEELLDVEGEARFAFLEGHLVRILALFLGAQEDAIRASDNLLELGLDSITAVRLRNMMQRWLGVAAVDPRGLLDKPTLTSLTRELERAATERIDALLRGDE